MNKVRVLIVEDHGLVRAGLRALLGGMPEIEVVGEARDASEGLRLVEEQHPDIVLMDISMPGMDGLAATRRIGALDRKPKVLVLSMHAERPYVREAFVAGASGYLLKDSESAELELAIAALARGHGWISPAVARGVIEDIANRPGEPEQRPGLHELTPRQREVLQLIAEGHSTKQIARRLGLSVKTVETHRGQIMTRLEIRHVAGLVRYAMRAGLVVDTA